MRHALAILGAFALAGCDPSPLDQDEVASTRAVQRAPVTLPDGVKPRGAAAREAAFAPPGPPVTPALLARGRDLWAAFCAPCHGSGGAGDGTVVARGFPAPPTLQDPRYAGLAPERTVAVIRQGAGLMYPMADRIGAPDDAWAIAHHLETLRRQDGR